jgi:hypothetical protein
MKKLSILFMALLCIQIAGAQDDESVQDTVKQGWQSSGDVLLLFNQAAFNKEWRGGGTSNYAGNLILNYSLIYNKDRFTWTTTFLGNYGLAKGKDDPFIRKTNDLLELNSIAGYQIDASKFFYSFFTNFRSQFAKGYKYGEEDVLDPDSGNVVDTQTTRTETTHFLSPGYLQFGPGVLYKRSENFKINLAPATARFIFVDDKFTTVDGYEDGDYFGVDQGEASRFEFGASLSIIANYQLMKNVSVENLLNLYSNYLEDPQNVDLDYTFKLNLKVNDYISANFIFQTIYDDNAVQAFQVREVIGVGLSYKLK